MWYPPTVTQAAASEPVTLDQVKQQASISHADDDALIARYIQAARGHVENYCGLKLITQTVTAKCDVFDDLQRLPLGPVQSISSVVYVDAAGANQTLSTSVYEVRIDGLDASIILKYGQAWPSVQPGSRITLTAIVGYTAVPDSIIHAMLFLIAYWYSHRESAVIDARAASIVAPMAFDDLLANYRLGV